MYRSAVYGWKNNPVDHTCWTLHTSTLHLSNASTFPLSSFSHVISFDLFTPIEVMKDHVLFAKCMTSYNYFSSFRRVVDSTFTKLWWWKDMTVLKVHCVKCMCFILCSIFMLTYIVWTKRRGILVFTYHLICHYLFDRSLQLNKWPIVVLGVD